MCRDVVRFLVCFTYLSSRVASFSPQPRTYKRAVTTSLIAFVSPKSSPLEDEPWKKDDSYWDMLQEASKDPATFEKFIEDSTKRKGKSAHDMKLDSPEVQAKPKKKGKYVPIEEWDAQQKESMSAEEKLQWECQQGGNRIRQNDILMHHLNSF